MRHASERRTPACAPAPGLVTRGIGLTPEQFRRFCVLRKVHVRITLGTRVSCRTQVGYGITRVHSSLRTLALGLLPAGRVTNARRPNLYSFSAIPAVDRDA